MASVTMAAPAYAWVVVTKASIRVEKAPTNRCLRLDWKASLPHVETCDPGNPPLPMQWAVESALPDTGYPNVKIKSLYSGDCLTAVSATTAHMLGCDPSRNSRQVWALTGYPGGTEQFYNFGVHSCLDSGQATLLFHDSNGCNPANPYQGWYIVNLS
ncbi:MULTISPECIES: hypothetical protein [Amycolatopsis]|uniref:Ricin B lectin domain-containing protein n=1 Tax=Amycolatopsis dendrobii TaxID=2760662 RepID=A0A7W3ZDI2_9PSEU|nr:MULTISPECIES: hypothetical protein [Amycolatopsis]MBB1157440.1 hypothetical protein [Amycolatopsis dendrobii]UKD59163.1 RICIN domain-containing protein [Amycolatopsis sp. FU40]